jgi:NADPH:quinone reductase-like Zn-dependent oxidoreductase
MPKALQFDSINGPLLIRDIEALQPGPGQVSLRVSAFALNQADLLYMRGHHYTFPTFPSRIAYEACGIVDAVGAGVTRFRVGDRVTTIPNVDGPYHVAGEYALADEDFLSAWPKDFPPEEACAFWMQYLTQYFPLKELFPIKAGDWVLVIAGASSAGFGALNLAKSMGARTIATSRTSDKAAVLLRNGADAFVPTLAPDIVSQILEITGGQGVKVASDPIGGTYTQNYMEALADGGSVYIYGALGGELALQIPVLTLVRKAAYVHGYSLINHTRSRESLARGREYIIEALSQGALPAPRIDRVFSFDEAVEAYRYMETGQQAGKIVVRVNP